MPATTEKMRKYMGAALQRKREGRSRPGDPKMSEKKLRHYASKPVVKKKGGRHGG